LRKWGDYAQDVQFVLRKSSEHNAMKNETASLAPFQQYQQVHPPRLPLSSVPSDFCQQSTLPHQMPFPEKLTASDGLNTYICHPLKTGQRPSPNISSSSGCSSSQPEVTRLLSHSTHSTHSSMPCNANSSMATHPAINDRTYASVTSPAQIYGYTSNYQALQKVVNGVGQQPEMKPSATYASIPKRPTDPLKVVSSIQRNVMMSEELMDEGPERKIRQTVSPNGRHPLTTSANNNSSHTNAHQQKLIRSPNQTVSGITSDSWRSMEERRRQEEVERKKQEKDTLLAKVAELDTQIALSRHKIQILSDRIREEEHRLGMEQRKKEMEEHRKQQDSLQQLREQIEQRQKDLDQQKKDSDALQNEIRILEENLKQKHDEMENVMKDIRKENLNALSLETPVISTTATPAGVSAFFKLHSERFGQNHLNSLIGSRFYNRIGSTRKMLGSPRLLETAVVSKKNPQGVWV